MSSFCIAKFELGEANGMSVHGYFEMLLFIVVTFHFQKAGWAFPIFVEFFLSSSLMQL